jgi:hypothetical protein
MTRPDNPYVAPIEQQCLEIPLHLKVVAGVVGTFVVAGTAMTLGAFLFGLLILIAGKSQPSPLAAVDWLESPLQKSIFGIGSIFIAITSFLLGSWTVLRIGKTQRLTAEVLYRRRELQLTVSKMHSAVMERNVPSQMPDVAIPDSGAMPHDT